jgi:glycerophosphoryl diester phosphodiesterase
LRKKCKPVKLAHVFMPKLTWESVARRDPRVRPLVMAHRGASEELPENTLPAFARALEQGADVLETDLRFTRDDVILLMHDATVERTTNGAGAVSEMTLAEVKKLRTRAPLPHAAREGREGVPTLEELLQFTRGDVPLALELKDDRFLHPRDAQCLIDLLGKYDALDTTVLVSFSLARMQTFRPLSRQLPIGMITLSNPLPLFPTEFLGPFFPLLFANPLYVWWARRLGKIVCPLDPAPEPRLGYYGRLGVAVVMTNHPGVTTRALERLYRH